MYFHLLILGIFGTDVCSDAALFGRYDWFAHHHTVWPSLACRWGRQLPDKLTHKTKQRLYYSEQTDGSSPNTLIVANADVIKPRVASADNVARRWSETGKSPYVRKVKTIFHPGEVNKIRDIYTGACSHMRRGRSGTQTQSACEYQPSS